MAGQLESFRRLRAEAPLSPRAGLHSWRPAGARAVLRSYAVWMLDLDAIDVEEIATALADQSDYEHRWLIDPRTGGVAFWTSDTGIDGRTRSN